MPSSIAHFLQTPRYSFWIFLAGFVAFRSLFFVILFLLFIVAFLSSSFENKDCAFKEHYKDGHLGIGLLFFLIMFIAPFFLMLFFYFFIPPEFLKEVSYFVASHTLFYLDIDRSMLIHSGVIHDNNAAYLSIKKINDQQFHTIAAVYITHLSGFIYAALFLSIVFSDLKCLIKRIYEKSKNFHASVSIIVTMLLIICIFLPLAISDYLIGPNFSSGFSRLSQVSTRSTIGTIMIWYFMTILFIYFLRIYFELTNRGK